MEMRKPTFMFLALITLTLFVLTTYNTLSMLLSYSTNSAALSTSPLDDSNYENSMLDPLVEKTGTDLKGEDHRPYVILNRPRPTPKLPNMKRLYHVVVTADGSKYSQWQCRIMYYWYKKFKGHPDSAMGGFTRLLHSGRPDDLMDEIPTFIVDPLPPGEDRGYVVLNRPWAFVQWLETATIEEEYVLMAEPDHIFVRPMPNLAVGDMPAGFHFHYIDPELNEKILRKFYPSEMGPITNIDKIGNSPVIIKKEQLMKIAPTWLNTSIAMKDDPEADEKFGWVLEMYGYATASALHGVKHVLKEDFMLQPPWQVELDGYMIHYTYALEYSMMGEFMKGKIGGWRFDKRSFTEDYLPRNLPLPPPGVPETVGTLIKALNEATANIPDWPEP
ncbi:unnamed protein product [Calypogeia fissa]